MMMQQQDLPTLFILGPILLIFVGAILFKWGKSLPGRGLWLVWATLLIVLLLLGLDTGIFGQQGFITRAWMVGWIWDKSELGAITVGLYQDRLAAAIIVILVIASGSVLLNRNLLFFEPFPERILTGISFALAGVSLTWVAITPWFVFLGLAICLLGAISAMGSRWSKNAQADISIRFILDRSIGLILAFLGALILTSFHAGIFLHHNDAWLSAEGHHLSIWLGSILLVLGLYVQMQPFPFLGWLFSDSDLISPFRIFLCQICPGWAALSILIRLQPQFSHLGLFPGFGWVALGSSFLIFLSGLFQKGWKQSINMWLAGGFSLSIAILAFSGSLAAWSVFLGTGIGGLIFALFYSNLASDSSGNRVKSRKLSWLKISVFLGAASSTGLIGFISSSGLFYWLDQSIHQPGELATFVVIFFFFSLLGWKIAWGMAHLQEKTDIAWSTHVSVVFLILFSLALLWTGSVSGHLISGDADQVMKSLVDILFGVSHSERESSGEHLTVVGLQFGILSLSFLFSYWSVGRKENQWDILSHFLPHFSKFVRTGYGVDFLAQYLSQALKWVGRKVEHLLDRQIWNIWLPKSLNILIQVLSKGSSEFDRRLVSGINHTIQRGVEIPAKFLQILQTGDLRWYLFLSLGSGFALLTHFLMR